jgi:guanylate kinase
MNNERTVKAVVVAGPSGVGKSTLIREALKNHPDWTFSISATTRPQRDHEKEGEDYFFLDRSQFIKRIGAGDFIEYAEVYGNLYGTLKSEFKRAADASKGLLIEIDTVGCLSIKALRPDIPIVAIAPPRYSVLRERLSNRGTESDDELELRVNNAWMELARMKLFDYVVVNDNLEKAALEFSNLMTVLEAGAIDVVPTIDSVLETAGETK